MPNLKHIGRLKNNKRRVIVPYRTLPGDPYSCLVVFVDTLSADEHDSLIKVVESSVGQQAYELAEVMNRNFLPDGRNMLAAFHKTGKLQKIDTSAVEMIPNSTSSIGLNELNELIANQRGIALEDLPLKPSNSKSQQDMPDVPEVEANTPTEPVKEAVTSPEQALQQVPAPLTDQELAKQFRSQADTMFKEAQRLRKEANELDPPKKSKTTRKATSNKDKDSA